MTDTPDASSLPDRPVRVPGVDRDALVAVLEEVDEELSRFPGSLAYQYSAAYAGRAHVRFALGFEPNDVLDDFWMAARSLAADPELHMSRLAPEQFLTRRITPVELGLLGGDLDLARRMARTFGFSVASARASMGGAEFLKEAKIISPALVGHLIVEPQHLAGFAAAIYASSLSSAIRGYADEVKLNLKLLSEVSFRGELPEALRNAMVRYTGLCEVLLEFVQPTGRNIAGIIADQIQRSTMLLAQRLGKGFAAPTAPQKYVDTGALSLIALGALLDHDLSDLPPHPEVTPYAVGYAEFIEVMSGERELPEVEGDLSPERAAEIARAMAGLPADATPPPGMMPDADDDDEE